MRRAALLTALALATLLGATGCGSEDGSSDPVAAAPGKTLTVYASLPARGPSAAAANAAELGMRRALAEADGRVGGRNLRLVVLSSTRPGEDSWDPGTIEANAERAVDDPSAIAYLGELGQGGSAVSLPVTNRATLLQVSPADGLTSLTRTPTGRPRSGPERYYEEGAHSFVRLVPPDLFLAREIAREVTPPGGRRPVLLRSERIDDRELDGIVAALVDAKGIAPEVHDVVPDDPEQLPDLVTEVVESRPSSIVLAAPSGPSTSALLAELARHAPDVPVYGGPSLALANPSGATPTEVTAFTGVLSARERPPAGRRLLAELGRALGSAVRPEALLGYEAMRLVLDAIEAAGPDRRAVARAALAPRERRGPLGRYSVLASGDIDGPGISRRPLGAP